MDVMLFSGGFFTYSIVYLLLCIMDVILLLFMLFSGRFFTYGFFDAFLLSYGFVIVVYRVD